MGDSNRGSTTVRSRGGVLSREGPFSEVPLYIPSGTNHQLQGRIQDSGKGGVNNSRNSAHARLLLCACVVCATHAHYCVR